MNPQRHHGDGQRHGDLQITFRRICPLESGAHIVEMPLVNRQPLGLRQRLAIGIGACEHRTIIFGMASGDLLEFARALQLLECVEARGVEQAILGDFSAGIGCD